MMTGVMGVAEKEKQIKDMFNLLFSFEFTLVPGHPDGERAVPGGGFQPWNRQNSVVLRFWQKGRF